MNRLTVEQLDRNAELRDNWEAGAAHRRRVMKLITEGFEPKQARLCILGAGNCNDLDLAQLAETFAEVHLVDLDEAALQAAALRQGVEGEASIQRHTATDVTGIGTQLSEWSPQQPVEDSDVEGVIKEANSFVGLEAPLANLPAPFDMVVSTCLISQLIEGVVKTLGEQHPRFVDLLCAVRGGHLRLMTALTAPGGYGLLVTDVVSAVTAPALRTMTDEQLPDALTRWIKAGNFFHGVNPLVLMRQFQSDPVVAPRVEEFSLIRPWRWKLGSRVFAVTAIKYSRANSGSTSHLAAE